MKFWKIKPFVSILLVAMLLVGTLPIPAMAEETEPDTGLCEHHLEHTDVCGYSPGSPATPCNHEHTSACWVTQEECIQKNMVSSASPEDTEPENEPAKAEPIPHECSEDTGCITKVLDCPHEHGTHEDTCGYSQEVPGTPCSYVCPWCGNDDPPELDTQDDSFHHSISGQLKPDVLLDGSSRFPSPVPGTNAVSEEETSKLPASAFTWAYINGKPIKRGENITATVGDSFSYRFAWGLASEPVIKEGDSFTHELFRIPGLNLSQTASGPLIVNGIRIGNWDTKYNSKTGVMTYRVVFTRYIQMFQLNSVTAQFQGNGKFAHKPDPPNTDIAIDGDAYANLTINPSKPAPVIPSVPSGVGWSPQKPPQFTYQAIPFGKGFKWSSKNNPNVVPQIDWRVAFLEPLQKAQQEFLSTGNFTKASNGYCIIEDTLDENQEFYSNVGSPRYKNGAPFHLELPVMVAGTNQILNGSAVNNLQNGNYDGNGEINTFITGEHFTQVDGSQAKTPEEIKKIKEQVKTTPLTWTVTTDPNTRCQTILINVGKLGVTDPSEGVTWGMAAGDTNWPAKKLQERMDECDNKIQDIQLGVDSPVQLLDNRYRNLSLLLQRNIQLSHNADVKEQAEQALQNWKENYQIWRDHPQIGPLRPFTDPETGELLLDPTIEEPTPIPMPEDDLPDILKNLKTSNNTLLTQSQEYKNYKISRDNLLKDQHTYLENRKSYGEDWAAAKHLYEQTKAFHEDGRIFGFVLKYFTTSINPSMTTYKNSVTFTMDDQTWEAEDTVNNLQFSNVIIGNYALGSVVLQKADRFYEDDEFQQVQNDKSGLTGAEFNIYCPDDQTGNLVMNDEHLAYFLDKDASENKNAYIYTHTGLNFSGLLRGEESTLQTNPDGRLVINGFAANHEHYLVETKAPNGYYLDQTPIRIDSNPNSIVYQLVPNVSRSVVLRKTDSYSGNPIQGAQFTLYQKKGNTLTPITGFAKKSLNDHETYWPQTGGKETLVTNEEGNLCIHGLDAGTYVLRETKAASGYHLGDPAPEYTFTLEELLPEQLDDYDKDYHLILEDLENDPKTNSITITKLDGSTPSSENKTKLPGAVYGLFRFTGTETEWKQHSGQSSYWQAIELSDPSPYFQTPNEIRKISGRKGATSSSGVVTDQYGKIEINEIPIGHYFFRELESPTKDYILDDSNYYFDVNGTDGIVHLRDHLTDTNHILANNLLYNYHKPAKLALVKYDLAQPPPAINGIPSEDGYVYDGASLKEGETGLPGAVYKLFEAEISVTEPNPDPAELKQTELLATPNESYDRCLAVGTTNEKGVLWLDNMTDWEHKTPYAGENGLHMGDYYLIEVQAPQGYLLDQTPVSFILNHSTFPSNYQPRAGEAVPGLLKLVGNRILDYGIRITKTDEQTQQPLSSAGFTITKQGEHTPLTISYDSQNQQYYLDPNATGTEMLTDEQGTLTVIGLEKGANYLLTEVRAPRGYQNLETPEIIATAEKGSIQEGHLILTERTIANQRRKNRMILHKQDGETKQPLQGATFQLYKTVLTPIPEDDPLYDPDQPLFTSKDEPVGAPQTTDENGNITFEDLEWEKYYFVLEVEAPPGYRLDATRLSFSIDETSFDLNGDPIPIVYPHVQNLKGSVSEVVITKVDHDDPTKKLPDAHFYLTKKIIDSHGNEFWPAYSTGMFITDQNGEMSFLLPPGEYHLEEMLPPEGYLRPELSHEGYYFTVKEPEEGQEPEKVEITLTNQKSSGGIYLKKTVANTDIPLAGVTFQFLIGIDFPPISTSSLLSFIEQKPGVYECVGKDGEASLPADASPEVTTDANGELRLFFPQEFLPDFPKDPLKTIIYREVRAPENIEVNLTPQAIPDFTLNNQWWSEVPVQNPLIDAGTPTILLHKTDEQGNPLEGAEFELHHELRLNDQIHDILVDTQVTDHDGKLTFQEHLYLGQNYYLVETKAPNGYVLDQTHHEITLDGKALDQNGYVIPVEVSIENTSLKGSAVLQKTDPEGNPLPDAEFELMHWSDNQWEHYGDLRYITDSKGEIHLTLPHGTYRWMERTAPIGYLLGNTQPIEFSIEQDKTEVVTVINEQDQNPKGSVTVTKMDREDKTPLSGAKFQLFYLGQDGQYYLHHTQGYVTNGAGQFKISQLPLGSYAFQEIQAPSGYQLPKKDTFYRFSIAYEGQEVELPVYNTKTMDPVFPTGTTDSPSSDQDTPSYPVADDSLFWIPDSPNSQPSGDGSFSSPSGDSSVSKPSDRPFGNSSASPSNPPDGPAKTGDDTNLTVWFILMGCSAGGIVLLFFVWALRKKKSK